MPRGVVGPSQASAGRRRADRRMHEPAPVRAVQPLGRRDVGVIGMATVGRRFVPPAERPAAGVAAEKRRERPRPRRANPARRPSAGSLTPHVSLSMSETGAARSRGEIARVIHGGMGGDFPSRSNTLRGVGRRHFVPHAHVYSDGKGRRSELAFCGSDGARQGCPRIGTPAR